jgi:hypothetical protein
MHGKENILTSQTFFLLLNFYSLARSLPFFIRNSCENFPYECALIVCVHVFKKYLYLSFLKQQSPQLSFYYRIGHVCVCLRLSYKGSTNGLDFFANGSLKCCKEREEKKHL